MKNGKRGQTLVLLLVFLAITAVIVSAVTVITIVNYTGATKFNQGDIALSIAESGAENGILRLIRDHNYLGETLPVGSGSAVISVSNGTSTPIITAIGTIKNFRRTVEVRGAFNNNVFTITSWKEL